MKTLLFNGKFLAAPPTGVHRVAEELIRAVDERLADEPARQAVLLAPPDARRALPLSHIETRTVGPSTWQIWEQVDLPRKAGQGLLINLCNLGPLARRDAITMIHDAQVHDSPASYSPGFRAYYKAVQPVIGRRHRAVLTVSDHSRRALVRCGVAPDRAIRVVRNGVDHVHRVAPKAEAARAYGLDPGRYVLALASGQAHKNIKLLIDCFRDPALADLTLALFGGDPPGSFSDRPPRNVHWLGRIEDPALFGLMKTAAAYACPSTTEGFGLPPLEAMALGAPVVAAPCGALPEVLSDAALYCPPDDVAPWVRSIREMADDGPAAWERRARGRARAAAFTWRRAADALLDVAASVERPARAASSKSDGKAREWAA